MDLRPGRRAGGWNGGHRPVHVDVLTYAPTVFTHCQHCEVAFGQAGIGERLHREQARDSLPQDLRSEFAEVAEWAHGLVSRHGSQIDVRVIDAASIRGFLTTLRYGTRRYPAVIVEREERFVGADLPLAEAEIERRVAAMAEATADGAEGEGGAET
ncbi:MAG TPA: hypothetical protein VE522_00355 [Actinomycetota bacterium]|nr:hypothetical protein [Actinomycetota bacterium]